MFAMLLTFRELWLAVRTAWRDPAFRSLAFLITFLLLAGALFYHEVEGWGWLDSLYFCLITLATVGYGDFSPKTAAGKIFTMIYIVIGIGVLLAVITRLAEALVVVHQEAHARRTRRRAGRQPGRIGRARPPRDPGGGSEAP